MTRSLSAAGYRRHAWEITAAAWLISGGAAGALVAGGAHFRITVVMLWTLILLVVTGFAALVHVIEHVLPDVAARAFTAGIEFGPPRPAADDLPEVRHLRR